MIRSLLALALSASAAAAERPNVLWIVIEDASPHIGCYGETAISTPHLDQLASEGVRFANALVTAPVCSPSRSALATGMYQTTIGAHNHRSGNLTAKAGGNEAYYASYDLPASTPLVSHLFRAAGYFTCNGQGPAARRPGKTDYNFVSSAAYDGADWRAAGDQPFFAQIQLRGGKSRPQGVPVGAFDLPPYYPDDALYRQDWAAYLSSWVQVDQQVGRIVADLQRAGVYEQTLICLITDHGVSHIRGKQFLYDEGVRIPMIVRFPNQQHAGTVRDDLALQIDLAPISLAAAEIPIPEHLQGENLFASSYEPREFVFAARDRCDETIEMIRAVRTARYKYIRNFLSFRPHLQFNQYKDNKPIVRRMRSMHADGQLEALQSTFFSVPRPTEELYDLVADPFETNNLAGDAAHNTTMVRLRAALYQWMVDSHDPGLIPEPILEELGQQYGSKLAAMRQPELHALIPRLIGVVAAGEQQQTQAVREAMSAASGSERYWAATWAGVNRDPGAVAALRRLSNDPVPTVRVAANLSLCQLGFADEYFPQLVGLIDDPNLIVGMYAMNAIEQSGIRNQAAARAAELAVASNYEFTRRYGRRLQPLTEPR